MTMNKKRQRQERTEYAAFLLSRRLPTCDIKSLLKSHFDVAPRTAERLLTAARQLLCTASGQSKEEHRRESLAFYQSIVSGVDTTIMEKLHAQSCIDTLLGLRVPRETRLTGQGGGPIAMQAVTFHIPYNGRDLLPIDDPIEHRASVHPPAEESQSG